MLHSMTTNAHDDKCTVIHGMLRKKFYIQISQHGCACVLAILEARESCTGLPVLV